jgi:hypothetical protein
VQNTKARLVFIFYGLLIQEVIIMATWIQKKFWDLVKLFYYPIEHFLAALDASPAAAAGEEAVCEDPSSM